MTFSPFSVPAFAKINVGLQVVRKRPDGYHDLQTVFYPTDFYQDNLEFFPSAQDFEFQVESDFDLGASHDNLCVKAFRLLQQDFNISGVGLKLRKEIPVGGGLGGGSSDAAVTLKTLNEIFSLNISRDKLLEYALKLGSDVPFFILNTPVYATGRGEIMTPIDLNLSDYELKIVKPDISVSTKEAYADIVPQQPAVFLPEVLKTDVASWKDFVVNDFEKSVFKKHPILAEIKEKFYADGAIYASMSGSGAAVFALFQK